MALTVLTVKTERMDSVFDLYQVVIESIKKNDLMLQDGDVLVISSKFVSNAQGRIIDINKVKPSKHGVEVSEKFQIQPKVSEIILRESDHIFGGIAGFVITSADNIMAPNAGIDKSNAKKGKVILYPNNPYKIAEDLRRKIFLNLLIHVGVILVDSRLMPARVGTTGVAIACAGIEPVNDMRAQKDLDGNPLKVTFQAVVDNLASIANHQMGEGGESRPIAIVRNSNAKLTDRRIDPNEVAISHDQCVYVRGLGNSN
ncbi:cytidine deaminase [Nitrosopumilus sp. b1]|uniref:coenzyme F420-0:L-glutamate ligase n=1 Tax=Nitrosopumilus sp. b1 TaxID=2109907 RepID=UPI0015F48351|nr:coenzyme F420-0:L-glutamate ligase [Nitrosopumilus sp. b1]KAF6243194.1 cytidine deaminase [Nitrosopumilus sp. b1]